MVFLQAVSDIVCSILIAALPSGNVNGQEATGRVVQTHVQLTQDTVHAGSVVYAVLSMTIQNGWHINSASTPDESMIPTTVNPAAVTGISVGMVHYPPGHEMQFPYLDRPSKVYSGTVHVVIELRISDDAAAGPYRVPLDITYQACNATICIAPSTHRAEVPLFIVPASEPASRVNSELYNVFVKHLKTEGRNR